jgi:glucoamylase
MDAFVGWVSRTQKLVDPNGFDIRINPKFELPIGAVYVGGWCRPQTDGPGLQSAALITYANILLAEGKTSYVKDTVIPLIKFDLDWIHSNWQSDGCDLWEEVHSGDFFWNRMGYVYTMDLASKFFKKVDDASYASKCESTKSAVSATLDSHWTGDYMYESSNRKLDGATLHAFSSFEAYSFTDAKIAKTIKTLGLTFCQEYQINQADNDKKLPGILIGRYPGDVYAGGNPWQLLTAVTAKLFYQGASTLLNKNGFNSSEDQEAWADLLNIKKDTGV